MKVLSLRPYHGEIHLHKKLKTLRAEYEQLMGEAYPFEDDPDGGRFIRVISGKASTTVFLVYASKFPYLAHEFGHVLLHTFRVVGHDPTQGDGEPFCYMLSQLLIEAAE